MLRFGDQPDICSVMAAPTEPRYSATAQSSLWSKGYLIPSVQKLLDDIDEEIDYPKDPPLDEPKAKKCKSEPFVAAGDKPANASIAAAQHEELHRYLMKANGVDVSFARRNGKTAIIIWPDTRHLIEHLKSVVGAAQ